MEILEMLQYLIIQGFGLGISIIVAGIFVFLILHKTHSFKIAILLFLFFFGTFTFLYLPAQFTTDLRYPFGLRTFGPSEEGPSLPLKNVFSFFKHLDDFERVSDIAIDASDVPDLPPPGEKISITLETKEVLAEVAPGVMVNYWTYNGTVPGPMLRVREGDTVEFTLKNNETSLHHHNIDLHAVTGPGGGGAVTNVAPGESKTFTFKALNPGLYVYHCAHANMPNHVSHGMYGMILVEPEGGLAKVDREFYVMQGELYTAGPLGRKGLQVIDGKKLLEGRPEYITFNGRVGGVTGNMTANVGETVRIFFGNGGVNLGSYFHVVGEIFDRVHQEAQIGGPVAQNVQTTTVPAGGATIVEFKTDVPGKYVLVDHALARVEKGAWGILDVFGKDNPEIFHGDAGLHANGTGH